MTSIEPPSSLWETARARRARLSASFDRAMQTPEEALQSARDMVASLERQGVLCRARQKEVATGVR